MECFGCCCTNNYYSSSSSVGWPSFVFQSLNTKKRLPFLLSPALHLPSPFLSISTPCIINKQIHPLQNIKLKPNSSLFLPLLLEGNGNNDNNNNNGGSGSWWWHDNSSGGGSHFPFPLFSIILFCSSILCCFCYLHLSKFALVRTTTTTTNSSTFQDSDSTKSSFVWEVSGGKRTKLIPDPFQDAFILANANAILSPHSFLPQNLWLCCTKLFYRFMLPQGFPYNVTNDYLKYSLWRRVQPNQCVLATQALLYAVGLGKGAIPTAATVNWVLKDGIGYLSKIMLSKYGRHFDVHSKGWRLFADLLENVAFRLEMLTPAFPHLFVPIGATAGAGRSAAALIQAATRSCFYSGFAAERNFAKVIAKGEAQGMVSKFNGIMLGIGLANNIGSSTSLALASFSVVTWIHMFYNLKSYQSIQLTTLNPYRARNIETSEAESMIQRIEDVFFSGPNAICQTLFPSQHVTNRIVKLGRGMSYFYPAEGLNPNDENSALVHYIQVHRDDFVLDVKLQLFALIAKQPALHQLRSVEQLGYITVLMQRNDPGIRGVQFIIQSTVKGPGNIDLRVEAFLKMFESKLYEMTNEEFKSNVNALIDMKLEKHKNLREECRFYWGEISDGTLKFDRRESEVAALRQLTQQELVDFFNECIKVGAPQRKTLSIGVYGNLHSSDYTAEKSEPVQPYSLKIDDIFSFRRSQSLYGSFRGVSDHSKL